MLTYAVADLGVEPAAEGRADWRGGARLAATGASPKHWTLHRPPCSAHPPRAFCTHRALPAPFPELTARCRRCTPQAQATPDRICRLSRSGRLTFADTVGQVIAGCADADYTVRVFPGAPLGLLHKYHRDATGTGVVTLKYVPASYLCLSCEGSNPKPPAYDRELLCFETLGLSHVGLASIDLDIQMCASLARAGCP